MLTNLDFDVFDNGPEDLIIRKFPIVLSHIFKSFPVQLAEDIMCQVIFPSVHQCLRHPQLKLLISPYCLIFQWLRFHQARAYNWV